MWTGQSLCHVTAIVSHGMFAQSHIPPLSSLREPSDTDIQKVLENEYCILTGKELTYLVNKEDFQWIWGTFSAFDPSTSNEDILKHKLPENDMYPGFWKNPLTMQHPLSKIEIVAFDSSYTLIFTKDFALPEKFKEYYPKAEDLELVNRSL